jgi:hypothetical protein
MVRRSGLNMDPLTILSIGVFLLGAALCAFFMFFLMRGKRIPGDRGDHQIIKYKDLELGVNSIMLLLIVSTAVAVAPLAVQYKLKLTPQAAAPPKEATIYLSGELKDGSDSAAKLADTPLTATNIVTKATAQAKTDQEGHFDFDPMKITPEANRIKLSINRDGYSPVEKLIVGNEQIIPITMSKAK